MPDRDTRSATVLGRTLAAVTYSRATTFRSLDGVRLAGTVVAPSGPVEAAVVLVHGGGVTRDEGHDDHLDEEHSRLLDEQGYIDFTPRLKHGRPLLNEVFWLQPHTVLDQIKTPTLTVHGTGDTLVPIDGSRAAVPRFTAPCTLVEIEGAQHGFAVHDDPGYLNPQSQAWQAQVIEKVAGRLRTDL